MTEGEFKQRTREYALRIIRLGHAMPARPETPVIRHQLLRAGTSVGANYRAACRGRSRKDVIAKLSIVEEETDESLFWMELIVEAGLLPADALQDLMQEGTEILSMTVTSIKTLRARQHPGGPPSNPKSKI